MQELKNSFERRAKTERRYEKIYKIERAQSHYFTYV
jgi:hypothetical protein